MLSFVSFKSEYKILSHNRYSAKCKSVYQNVLKTLRNLDTWTIGTNHKSSNNQKALKQKVLDMDFKLLSATGVFCPMKSVTF